MRRMCKYVAVLVAPIVIAMLPLAVSGADFFAVQAFERQWQMDEARIPNYWGPLATATNGVLEPYAEGSSGPICRPNQPCLTILYTNKRTVQYFDKGRMEQTNPGAPVTSGLLATELVRGKVQTGDNQFEVRTPPDIPIAGDLDNTAPTYRQLATTASSLLAPAPAAVGTHVTVSVNAQGKVEDNGGWAGISFWPAIGVYDAATQHNALDTFAAYRDRAGFLTIGNAISEPFLATVKLRGTPRVVIVQMFERRVLTYTPTNPDAYKVEMGNIGQHYYQWRYPTGA